MFGEIRRVLGLALNIGSPHIDRVAPETLLHLLHDSGLPVSDTICGLLSGGRPNAAHEMLAEALGRGATIWTPNADELIEKAAGLLSLGEDVAAGRWHVMDPGSRRLCKPHGTVSNPDTLAFRAPQVLGPLPVGWISRLLSDLSDRHVIIAGYAGADPDIGPVLKEGLCSSRSAIWFERPDGLAQIEHRYREPMALGRLRIMPADNPTLALVREMERRAAGVVSPAARDLLSVFPPPVTLKAGSWNNGRHLAAGRVLEHVGDVPEAVRRLRRGVTHGHQGERRRALGHLLGIGLYQGATCTRPLRKMTSLAVRVPGIPRRSDLMSLECRLLEKEGDYKNSLEWARKATIRHTDDVGRTLDVCAAARKAGALRLACELSTECVLKAKSGRADGPTLARAFFELTFALRWSGRLVEAWVALGEFEGLDLFGGPNWIGWAKFERGCLLTLEPRATERGTDSLQEAIEIFEMTGERHKVAQAMSAQVSALRGEGRTDKAKELLESTATLRASLPRASAFEDEALAFERAELERLDGRDTEARRIYTRVLQSDCPVHDILGRLGLAELDRKENNGPLFAWDALRRSERIDFRFGAAASLLCLAAMDAISEDVALSRLQMTFPHRRGTSLDDFRRGGLPHRLIFP